MYLKTPEGIPGYLFGTHGTRVLGFMFLAELQPKSWMQRFLCVPFLMFQLSAPQPILHQLQRSPAHSKGPDQGCRMSRAQIDLMEGLLSCSRNRGCNDFACPWGQDFLSFVGSMQVLYQGTWVCQLPGVNYSSQTQVAECDRSKMGMWKCKILNSDMAISYCM
jgi:hypothetical protein